VAAHSDLGESEISLTDVSLFGVLLSVLGYSSDLLPFVGEMPDREGIFLSAGFTGHGESGAEISCSQLS
jgi:hypothetical protein